MTFLFWIENYQQSNFLGQSEVPHFLVVVALAWYSVTIFKNRNSSSVTFFVCVWWNNKGELNASNATLTTELRENFNCIFTDYKIHPYKRPCIANAIQMTCEYYFTVEVYYTMSKACFMCPFVESDYSKPHCVSADGFGRGIIVVNRKMPGPAIHAIPWIYTVEYGLGKLTFKIQTFITHLLYSINLRASFLSGNM